MDDETCQVRLFNRQVRIVGRAAQRVHAECMHFFGRPCEGEVDFLVDTTSRDVKAFSANRSVAVGRESVEHRPADDGGRRGDNAGEIC